MSLLQILLANFLKYQQNFKLSKFSLKVSAILQNQCISSRDKCQQFSEVSAIFSKSANFSKRCQQFSENQCISQEKMSAVFLKCQQIFLKWQQVSPSSDFSNVLHYFVGLPFGVDTSCPSVGRGDRLSKSVFWVLFSIWEL